MAKIEKTTIIGDILDIAPETAPRGETVEEACMVHGVDADELLVELNKMVKD